MAQPLRQFKALLFSKPGDTFGAVALAAAYAIGIFLLFRTACVIEDAFITFRVVDNFVHGYGLRWNVDERVQAYTNPLWLLLHIPFYFLWDNIYLLTLALSFACTVASVIVVIRTFEKAPATVAFALIAPLCFSYAWLEYSTSGMENPLNHLLFAIFGWLLVRGKSSRQWFWLSLVAALAMLNRLDNILFFAPTLCWLAIKRQPPVRIRQVLAGFAPLVAWFAFSLFYYGFLFPNTKYAKLNTGIPLQGYIHQGLHYLDDFIITQSPMALVLFTGLLIGLWNSRRLKQLSYLNGLIFSLSLGLGIYCVYVVVAGGDYMSGRFFTLPFFIALWQVYALVPPRLPAWALLAVLGCFSGLHLFSSHMVEIWRNCARCQHWSVLDEQAVYRNGNALINWDPFFFQDDAYYSLAQEGRMLKANPSPVPRVYYNIGMPGYYGGPGVKIMDMFALSDALMARLPVEDLNHWRIGHFKREFPKGYIILRASGNTELMNPDLLQYYNKLHLIISGDLWDPERLKTILLFNLGYYDHWKEAYLANRD